MAERSRHRCRLLVVGLALATCCLGAQAPSAGAARPLATGISDPETTDIALPLVYNRIHAAGARFVRLTFLWQAIAPAQEPILPWDPTNPADLNYDWTLPDREIRRTVAAGLTPVVQVYTAPRWAQRCHAVTEANAPCDPDPGATAEFATALARRYDGGFLGLPKVRYFELFNEPNLSIYFNPQFRAGKPVSPQLFRTLLNAFSTAVKAVDPKNLVLGPDMAPLGGPAAVAPMDFMRRMLCMEGRRNPHPLPGCRHRARFDVWATNPYTTGGPTHHARHPDDVSLGDLPEMRRLLRAAERTGQIRTALHPVPFWVTEFSWDSRPPDPGGLPWWLHARWAAEALYRAWKAGVSAFFWNKLRDQNPGDGPGNFAQGALYLRGPSLAKDRPKRVLRAFRFPFVAFATGHGIRVWGRTPYSRSGRVLIEVRSGNGWRPLASLRANRFGIFERVLKTRFGRSQHGLVRARNAGISAVPFSLHYVHDIYVQPFGNYRPSFGF
jgi:hypothetical protein